MKKQLAKPVYPIDLDTDEHGYARLTQELPEGVQQVSIAGLTAPANGDTFVLTLPGGVSLQRTFGAAGISVWEFSSVNGDRFFATDDAGAQKGEAQVALITGEEKIVPSGAKWFACTVEAMPLDRAVEFLAGGKVFLTGGFVEDGIFALGSVTVPGSSVGGTASVTVRPRQAESDRKSVV